MENNLPNPSRVKQIKDIGYHTALNLIFIGFIVEITMILLGNYEAAMAGFFCTYFSGIILGLVFPEEVIEHRNGESA